MSSRERIVKSALSLFSANGITSTTTKEIAEGAGVNEVTLFRQFGSKQGLLLAVIKEAPLLKTMQAALTDITGANNPISAYGAGGLELLGQVPELMRSLIGESGQAPPENQQALAQILSGANQQTVSYLRGEQFNPLELTVEESAKLLNTLLLGYALMQASSGDQALWPNQSDLLSAVSKEFSQTDISVQADMPSEIKIPQNKKDKLLNLPTAKRKSAIQNNRDSETADVLDLPAEIVRLLFQKAKKQSQQAYALIYVLFGSGLQLEECAGLLRSHIFASKNQHLLTITGPHARQVSVNRWIMGHRYGTHLKNPLTQWIKNHSDNQPQIFISESGNALTPQGIEDIWTQTVTNLGLSIIETPHPFQARQTWCIELLSKGMNLENLSLLSGLSLAALAPYEKRAKEKAALEAAIAIDQKNSP